MYRVLALALLCIACPSLGIASPVTVRGTVLVSETTPLPGVKVTVSETAQTVETGPDGTFALTLDAAPARIHLVFERDGFYPSKRDLSPAEAAAELRIVMIALKTVSEDVTVSASRLEIPLRVNPASTTVVDSEILESMARGVAAEEALLTVPGVKVDNQADGERVHLSIRGQGILTERGVRGIEVLLDGIPLNDPSGFAPDLFDVDWMAVDRIEVLRGPVAFLYGGGSSGGIINIATRQGGKDTLAGRLWTSGGSNGYSKVFGEAGGTSRNVNYNLTASGMRGDGYRDHTAFWANNLYGKLGWQVTPKLHLSAMVANTDYFNENAEGLNLTWLAQDRRMANPDALTYNEYQKTERQTFGVTGRLEVTSRQALTFAAYFRNTEYTESVPSSVQHRGLDAPGFNMQYTIRTGQGRLRNSFSLGTDLDWQNIDEYRLPNLGHAQEGDGRLSDQTARQNRLGFFAQDRLEMGQRWAALAGLRYDRIDNQLTDRMKANGLDLSGDTKFEKATGRVGVSFNAARNLDLYASWGQGFLPPATEELYANPDALGGFNRGLTSATSVGEEVGLRGSFQKRLFYDVAAFYLKTTNDFERYRISSRPLETFYHNAGNSKRYGIETQVKWFPLSQLAFQLAYTFNHFTYSSYSSFVFPGDLSGNWLPNSPRHQAYLEIEYRYRGWILNVNDLIESQAYVDATNQPSIDGYSLLGARLAYRWKGTRGQAELFVTGRNLTGVEYIAFTEPDPDGNSYQPGPKAEFFGGLQVRF